jgi:transcriptional regulator with XRE-family HTH domain
MGMTELTPRTCRRIRRLLGWKREKLAEKAEVELAALVAYENNQAHITPKALQNIVAAFEVSGLSTRRKRRVYDVLINNWHAPIFFWLGYLTKKLFF